MKHFLVLSLMFLLVIASGLIGFPTSAQNPLATLTCGLGSYWLVQDNDWISVWMRRGDSSTFDARGAFWMEDDGSATLDITLNGNDVSISRVDDPNVWGTLTCTYEGTVRPDGVSVVGSATCQLTTGISRALSWSAAIVCDTPLITWHDTAFWHRAAKGSQFSFECPPGGDPKSIWGTDIYIEGSSICTAAVHAGAITLEDGGIVTIEILPGEMSYPGSTRNGVTSETFPTPGQFDASFRIVGGNLPPMTATPVLGTGAVQVTLNWDNQADMDLSVVEPNGQTISYGNRQSSTGGQLDVDSNYPCGSNLFSVENIFWPTTGAPSGTYRVMVNEYSQCDDGAANWTLTVRVNGQVVLTQQGTGGQSEFTFSNGDGGATMTPAPQNVTGTWQTDYGTIEITGTTGSYNQSTAGVSHVTFDFVDAYTVEGYWDQPSSGARCDTQRNGTNYWGRIRWTFDETYSSFTGIWSYCDEELGGGWNGRRAG
jgi:hypothetical protein